MRPSCCSWLQRGWTRDLFVQWDCTGGETRGRLVFTSCSCGPFVACLHFRARAPRMPISMIILSVSSKRADLICLRLLARLAFGVLAAERLDARHGCAAGLRGWRGSRHDCSQDVVHVGRLLLACPFRGERERPSCSVSILILNVSLKRAACFRLQPPCATCVRLSWYCGSAVGRETRLLGGVAVAARLATRL